MTYKRGDVTSPKTEGAESESESEGEPEPKEQKVQEIDLIKIDYVDGKIVIMMMVLVSLYLWFIIFPLKLLKWIFTITRN